LIYKGVSMDLKARVPKVVILTAATITVLILAFYLHQNDNKLYYKDAYIYNNDEEVNPYRKAQLTVEFILVPNNTYGYNIKMNGRILIHQPNAPAFPGIEGFLTKEDAQKVGGFVISKIRKNIFPPSVSVSELDSLGVLKTNKEELK